MVRTTAESFTVLPLPVMHHLYKMTFMCYYKTVADNSVVPHRDTK